MGISKRLADLKERPSEQWLSAANRYLPPSVTALLVIGIAYQLAALTWTVAHDEPTAPAQIAWPTMSAAVTPTSSVLLGLANAHLFGEAKKEAAPVAAEIVDAPDTTLSLMLTGILAGGGALGGQAIISSNRGEEKTYKIGATIENADGAVLHSVADDRVLLNRNGTIEALRLPENSTSAATDARIPPLPTAMQQAESGTLHGAISGNASPLSNTVRVAPDVQAGQVVGFRINPGPNRAAFFKLGFKAGDVITNINGTVLNDPSQDLQVFESLGEATQANVTVLREGVARIIIIDTTQLQDPPANRDQ